jgi:hypothetical protein
MPFIPQGDEDLWDLAAFMLAPVLTVPTLVYSSAGYLTGEYPYGKPDWGANLRNATIWAVSAGGVYAWNYFMSPHNAVFTSGSSAWKIAAHVAAGSAAPIAAVGLLVGTPLAMIANRDDPAQGRQLQTAGSGQPSIGSGATWLLG